MNRRCDRCKQKISTKLYDCRALMCRLGRIEQSMREVCRVLDGVGCRKHGGCRRCASCRNCGSCGKKRCGRTQEAKGRQEG